MRKSYLAALVLALVWNAMPSAGAQTQQTDEKPYKINNGVTDWYTFSGYKRYHSECHVCHGPDGLGSSFAPSLVDSLKTMTYDQFLDTVTNGKTEVSVSSQKKMPAFGNNPNVMCFIDDIYAYLKARADGALERGRPQHVDKPEEAKTRDDSCLGST